jgi:hypothetical protein
MCMSSLIYRTAAGAELALVLVEMAVGHQLLPINHATQISIIFGAAFLLDESLSIAKMMFDSLKCALIRRTWANEEREKRLALEKSQQERLEKALHDR